MDYDNHRIALSQALAIDKLVRSVGIKDEVADLPMKPGLKLVRLKEHEKGINPKTCVQGQPYLSVIGSLLYISTCTRPDIAFAVNNLARHSSAIGKAHIKAVEQVVKYLNGTRNLGIVFHKPTDDQLRKASVYHGATHPCDPMKEYLMRTYADADYAGSDDRKSTTGYLIIINGAPVAWRLCKQKSLHRVPQKVRLSVQPRQPKKLFI